MANARTTIRNAYATAALQRAKSADGVEIMLAHEGDGGVPLWALMDAPDMSVDYSDGAAQEYTVRTFRVPLQTGFSGALSEADEITYGGVVFVVVSPWTWEDYESTAVIRAGAKVTRRSAMRS